MKGLILFSIMLLMILCNGCSTVTLITSYPSGAVITLNGNYVGNTPVSVKVDDTSGQSTYAFTATKNGYSSDSKLILEASGINLGPVSCVPSHIHFDLEPFKDQKHTDRFYYTAQKHRLYFLKDLY